MHYAKGSGMRRTAAGFAFIGLLGTGGPTGDPPRQHSRNSSNSSSSPGQTIHYLTVAPDDHLLLSRTGAATVRDRSADQLIVAYYSGYAPPKGSNMSPN